MIKFIKLHEVYNTLNVPLILNVACIRSIKLGHKNKDTMIQCDDIKFFFVAESVDQIWEMIKS